MVESVCNDTAILEPVCYGFVTLGTKLSIKTRAVAGRQFSGRGATLAEGSNLPRRPAVISLKHREPSLELMKPPGYGTAEHFRQEVADLLKLPPGSGDAVVCRALLDKGADFLVWYETRLLAIAESERPTTRRNRRTTRRGDRTQRLVLRR